MTGEKIALKDLSVVALFAALIALGAFVKIPFPGVPLTLQGVFVLLAGLLLGPQKASLLLAFIFLLA